MNRDQMIKGLIIERECVSRDCDRNCGQCDLVQDREWLLSVYDNAIEVLKNEPEIIRCRDCIFFRDGGDEQDSWVHCSLHSMNADPENFCAWAVKAK